MIGTITKAATVQGSYSGAAVGAIACGAIILSKGAVMDVPTMPVWSPGFYWCDLRKYPNTLIILGAGIVGLTVKRGLS